MTEVQLMEACKRKEPFAQRSLYDLFADKMYLLCVRYLSSPHDAEEVLSDAFIRVFNNIHQFSYMGEGSARAWVSRIVMNECLMFLRKKKLLTISVEDSPLSVVVADNENILDHIHVREILKHVRELPAGYRTVLNLYVFEGRGHKEIAELLQISENTSKSQLFKARALLKQKIQDG